ncbi:unnamed protein product [Zymoseptoria tritici ST99CH_1E4]|uniref:Uncharacterized protein n=1 Tax=Zymoseptoria tritici ST99CH_1E4 TaxID=1276532 RepID=A0A2H1G3H4_ZYMTR|nr:unnamed protein product [Zymoseptoria tritici ST99CH_1E4]
MSALPSRGARHLRRLSHRPFSTTPSLLDDTTTTSPSSTPPLPDLAQQLASNDPTATVEFLKLQHDEQTLKTTRSLARLSTTLTKLSIGLQSLTESLSTIRPPPSAAKPTRQKPNAIPPFIVQPWRKENPRVKDWTSSHVEVVERLRLHLQDLVAEPFPADIKPGPVAEIRRSMKDAEEEEQERRLRNVKLLLKGERVRAETRVEELVRKVEEMKRNEETRREMLGQAEVEKRRLREVERVGLPEGVGGGKGKQAEGQGEGERELTGNSRTHKRRLTRQRSRRRKGLDKGDGGVEGAIPEAKVNEDGTVSFSPLASGSEAVVGWGATAPKLAKVTESDGREANPFKDNQRDASEQKDAGTVEVPKKWFTGFGFGRKKAEEETKQEAALEAAEEKPSENTDSKAGDTKKEAAPEAAKDKRNGNTDSKASLFALQAALEKGKSGPLGGS